MTGWDNQLTIILLLVSNLTAILQFFFALRWPRIARISFSLLFAWAAWTNWNISHQHPEYYLDYAELAWSQWYIDFIKGWFARHVTTVVGMIAICQALIAVSMMLKGWIFHLGAAGAIIFLLSIVPLGTGAGFPCTAIMAAAIYMLMRNGPVESIWKPRTTTENTKLSILADTDNNQGSQ